MAQRKLQQEIDKCFKQVDIGVEAFDGQYEKYEQAANASQREKQVDTLKKECKKLQRLRDQIKQWAASNEVKDKGPLQDKRELIETKMEAFKAVEKEMKTKAFSKEGLLVSAKMDPKEREKDEIRTFLGDMVDELGRQIEESEAETESLQLQTKKKKDSGKAERVLELETRVERHKWHQNKLELLMRALNNEDVEAEQIKERQEDIQHYVDNNREVDFYEDDEIYDDFNLEEGADRYGTHQDQDPASSPDNQSEDTPDPPGLSEPGKPRTKSGADVVVPGRRPSQQIKSPLPALATLNNLPAAIPATVHPPSNSMKPAPPPSKPPGETLKYASAAAAGAANDAAGIGISPLPPPPGRAVGTTSAVPTTIPSMSEAPDTSVKSSATPSPAISTTQPTRASVPETRPSIPAFPASRSPAPSQSSASPAVTAAQLAQASARDQPPPVPQANGVLNKEPARTEVIGGQAHDRMAPASINPAPSQPNGVHTEETQEDESVFHLPSSLQDLIDSFEEVKNNMPPPSAPEHQVLLQSSYSSRPDNLDAERPRPYKPNKAAIFTPSHYPQEPLPIFNDPRLYSRVDHDALFYSFYYRQGSFQQYLAAKELKNNSWRFHKQYQTWFQRHEEPQVITEDYERGTYRFFDYESTWMNRRKGDFEFKYKWLEDDL